MTTERHRQFNCSALRYSRAGPFLHRGSPPSLHKKTASRLWHTLAHSLVSRLPLRQRWVDFFFLYITARPAWNTWTRTYIISTRTTPPTPPPPQPARRSERPARRNFSIGGKWRSDTSGRQPGCACDWSAEEEGSDGKDASIMQTGTIKNLQY